MTSALFSEVVTLMSRQVVGRDDLGNDTHEWVQADSPAWVEARQSTENTDAREQSTANSWVYLPLETLLPVAAVGLVVWRGLEWEVDGEPGLQPGGFVVDGYQQVAIKRVNG